MFQTSKKATSKGFAAAILALLFCVVPGCVAPEAVKTEIQGIRNDMGQLEKVVEQKADNTVVSEQVGEINNKIEQTTQLAEELSVWRKSVQADTINYGGAGWVVVGTGVMAIIFVGTGFLLIRMLMKRGRLLKLITCVIQKVGQKSPETIKSIKEQLKAETSNGKSFTKRDRQELGNFAEKSGTFAKQNNSLDV